MDNRRWWTKPTRSMLRDSPLSWRQRLLLLLLLLLLFLFCCCCGDWRQLVLPGSRTDAGVSNQSIDETKTRLKQSKLSRVPHEIFSGERKFWSHEPKPAFNYLFWFFVFWFPICNPTSIKEPNRETNLRFNFSGSDRDIANIFFFLLFASVFVFFFIIIIIFFFLFFFLFFYSIFSVVVFVSFLSILLSSCLSPPPLPLPSPTLCGGSAQLCFWWWYLHGGHPSAFVGR